MSKEKMYFKYIYVLEIYKNSSCLVACLSIIIIKQQKYLFLDFKHVRLYIFILYALFLENNVQISMKMRKMFNFSFKRPA